MQAVKVQDDGNQRGVENGAAGSATRLATKKGKLVTLVPGGTTLMCCRQVSGVLIPGSCPTKCRSISCCQPAASKPPHHGSGPGS